MVCLSWAFSASDSVDMARAQYSPPMPLSIPTPGAPALTETPSAGASPPPIVPWLAPGS